MANRNPKAQIAVIITLVIAAIFLFIIVFINLAKVSNIKTLTSQVADRSALSLASQIGSMSHNLKDKVLGGKTEDCDKFNWVALGAILAGILIAVLTLGFGWPVSVFLLGVGLAGLGLINAYNSSLPINKAIYEQFKGMTTYNGIREATLYQALSSLQTDDTLLRPSGNGIFFDDIDNDQIKDAGEPEYNLSSIEAIRNAKKTGRFFAWYYLFRLPLVSDEPLRPKIEEFLNNLRNYIEFYDWDAVNWIHKKASLVVGPVNVTCSSCPSWVYDAANGRVSVLTINEDDKDGQGNYRPSGFLKEKFRPLAAELENRDYDLSFCATPWSWICWWCDPTCSDIDDLIEDLNMLVARTKEWVDLPVSLRFQGIDTWLPLFYDLKYTHTPEGGGHDIYDRLTRDEIEINDWITELKEKNDEIIPAIEDDQGTSCEQGRGELVARCYTDLIVCYCRHHEESCAIVCDGDMCTDLEDARWRGPYGTCTGSGFDHSAHPVCQNGDLYRTIPSWCSDLRGHVPCITHSDMCSSCSPPPNITTVDKSYYFQGQLAWNNPGPTEVAQAIEILERVLNDIGEIKGYIEAFAREASLLLPKENVIRNEIVYAWTDKKTDNNELYSHLVAVKLMNYPEGLPHITEERRWGGFQKCRVLRGGSNDNGSGDLTITTWRYDEDRPTPWWIMRQRKKPAEAQFDRTKLQAIVRDIQNDGLIGITTAPYLVDLSGNYAVTSSAKAEYSPEKDKIKIVETH